MSALAVDAWVVVAPWISPAGTLDLDDFGTLVSQQHRAIRRCDVLPQLQDAQALQRSHMTLASLLLVFVQNDDRLDVLLGAHPRERLGGPVEPVPVRYDRAEVVAIRS